MDLSIFFRLGMRRNKSDMNETRASRSDHNANNQPSGSTDCNSFILENVMLRCVLPLRFIVCNLGIL